MNTNDTKKAQVSNDSALCDGLAKNHKQTEKLALDGKEVTVGEAMKMLRQRVALAKEADELRAQLHAKVAAYHALIAETRGTVSTLRTTLIARLGKTSPSLVEYGIRPRKVRTALTLEERVFAVAKAKATRTARHTMSKKQRLEIEGERPTHIVFGADASSTPVAPAPAPMTAPPNGTNGAAIAAATNGTASS
jgi:hypothetical protein